MIILDEVAKKLQNILNGKDSETQSFQNPTGFDFVVYTPGLHIDTLAKKDKGSNFIPVFISSMGGAHNPVLQLKQGNYTIPIVFYYPVRFKDDFFALYDFLADVFIGAYLNYGANSGKAVSNISVPRNGEIQDLDFTAFKTWVEEKFRQPIEIMEPYLSMELTLYLSSAAPEFVYGNGVSTSLSFKIKNAEDVEETYTDDDVTVEENTIQSQAQVQSEQLEGSGESQGLPFGVAYGSGFSCYYKDNEFYAKLLELWTTGESQNLELVLSISIPSNTHIDLVSGEPAPIVFTRKVFIESVVLTARKGQLITFNFTFSKRISEVE